MPPHQMKMSALALFVWSHLRKAVQERFQVPVCEMQTVDSWSLKCTPGKEIYVCQL